MGIHKGVMVSFAAPDKNWSFHLHFIPPLHRQTCGRPPTITRTHVFTVDVSHCMISRPYPLVRVSLYDKPLLSLLMTFKSLLTALVVM